MFLYQKINTYMLIILAAPKTMAQFNINEKTNLVRQERINFSNFEQVASNVSFR